MHLRLPRPTAPLVATVLAAAALTAPPAAHADTPEQPATEQVTVTVTDTGDLHVTTHTGKRPSTTSKAGTTTVTAPNYTRHTANRPDPNRWRQWSLDTLQAETVWATATGKDTVVAVIDSGVANHPDLAGQLLHGNDFVRDDRTGTTDGTDDGNGHGTHVAGIVAAVRNNGVGIAGLSPDTKILPVRVLDDDGAGYDNEIIEGLRWAVNNGADIVNLSLGSDQHSPAFKTAVDWATNQGVLVIAAAGNSGQACTQRTLPDCGNPTFYPAAYPNAVAVAATNHKGATTDYSQRGNWVDIAAPGHDILSTERGSYRLQSGTSMAAPHVSATAALLHELNNTETPAQLRARLTATATDKGAVGHDPKYGHGIVNPLRATGTAGEPTPPGPEQPETPTQPDNSRVSFSLFTNTKQVLTGNKVAVNGTVITDEPGNRAGKKVRLAITPQGKNTRYKTKKTNRLGIVKWKVKVARTTRFRISYKPAGKARQSSKAVKVKAKMKVNVALKHNPQRTVLSGRVRPAQRTTVILQRNHNGKWKRVKKVATAANGTYKLNFKRLTKPAIYRVKAKKSNGVLANTTNAFTTPPRR